MSQSSPHLSDSGSSAVFLSYASQDTVAATRIAEALSAAGIDVWFDRNELRGGDAWDRRIRSEIRACRLFIPVVSCSTEARTEGYFRREWKLAADRTHDLSDRVAFLLPIVIDSTSEATADVPEAFRHVQWTRLADGHPTAAFVENVSKLLGRAPPVGPGETGRAQGPAQGPAQAPSNVPSSRARTLPWRALVVTLFVFLLGAGYLVRIGFPGAVGKVAGHQIGVPVHGSVATAVPEKSVAVLPFVDMSESHDQEYFSDGMAEELIDLLVKIPGLRVPAWSSSSYFKGKPARVQEIAAQLGVAHVLEGTIRKQGNHLRVSTRLVQAATGYSVWSESYDRELRDVFQTQDEIATAVVKALKISLLQGHVPSAERTHSAEAYELYLRARALSATVTTENMSRAYADLRKAVTLDPGFALAWAGIAEALSEDNWDIRKIYGETSAPMQLVWPNVWATARAEARSAADRAVELAPDSAEAHLAKGAVLTRIEWDWPGGSAELDRALALAPDDTRVMLAAAELDVIRGEISQGVDLAKRAEELDPLGKARRVIAMGNAAAGDLVSAELSARRIVELYPTEEDAEFNLGCILLLRGELQESLEAFRRSPRNVPFFYLGPPLALDALGRHEEADSAMADAEPRFGADMAYQIAYFYARRGQTARAIEWLERARAQHDGGLSRAKIDPMLRDLRGSKGFRDLLQTLKLTPAA